MKVRTGSVLQTSPFTFQTSIWSQRSKETLRSWGYDKLCQAGAYFVTICTQNRECLLGDIVNGDMRLNDAGRMICHWYFELEHKFPDIECDAFICMPNHVHFIVVNVGAEIREPITEYGVETWMA